MKRFGYSLVWCNLINCIGKFTKIKTWERLVILSRLPKGSLQKKVWKCHVSLWPPQKIHRLHHKNLKLTYLVFCFPSHPRWILASLPTSLPVCSMEPHHSWSRTAAELLEFELPMKISHAMFNVHGHGEHRWTSHHIRLLSFFTKMKNWVEWLFLESF